MDGSEQNSENEINRVKYFLAFMKYSRECLEDCFYLLYTTWGRGRSYTTLQEFCVECLNLTKEQLSEIMCRPESVPLIGSASSNVVVQCEVNEDKPETLKEESNVLSSNSHLSLPFSKSFPRLRRREELKNKHQSMINSVGSLRKLFLPEDQHQWGRATFYLSEDLKDNVVSEVSLDGDSNVSVSDDAPRTKHSDIPKTATTRSLWTLVKRLLLPKQNKLHNNSNILPLKSSQITSQIPTRRSISVYEVQTQPPVIDKDLKSSNSMCESEESKYKVNNLFFLHGDRQNSCFRNADLDPTQMPLPVLVTLVTNVFPEITPKIRHLIDQLLHLINAVCYQDLEFDDQQLKFRLQSMSNVISQLIAAVINICSVVTQRFITETSIKLRASKQKQKRAQLEYNEHLKKLEKTQQKLEVVQEEIKGIEINNSDILRAYSRSWNREIEETCETLSTYGGRKSSRSFAKIATCVDDNMIDGVDFGNLSEDMEEEEPLNEETDKESDDFCSDSLLVSVMREVAVIEKRHSLRSLDRARGTKTNVRKGHKSVIITKREMRERLNSNASAKQDAMSKEQILSVERGKTRMLSKAIQRLRRNLQDLESDEKAIMSRINHDLKAIVEDNLVDFVVRKGQQTVDQLREGSGQLLLNSRKEAKKFASRARVLDLGEWVMRRVYATTEVRQVYSFVRAADTNNSINITDLVGVHKQQPPAIILSGPKASGKTCMVFHILHLWESNKEVIKSNISEFDLVVYGTIGSILSSGSWVQYLREHIFCLTFKDFSDSQVYKTLNTMHVLFLLEMDIINSSAVKIMDDVFENLGNNQVIVTTRPDGENPITRTIKRHDLKFLSVRMCPMTATAIQKYSTNLLSLVVEQDNLVVSNAVKQFLRLVNSMNVTQEILYPLPMTYLLYLWRTNPGHAFQATSMSRLFSKVTVVSEISFMEALNTSGKSDSATARNRAEECTKQLWESAWKMVTRDRWPYESHFPIEFENLSFKDSIEMSSFGTLVSLKESPDGTQQAGFLHPCIAEILCGFYLTQKRLLHNDYSLLRRREKLEKYCVPEIKRFKEVLPHAAAALVYNKHKFEDAKEIASLFFSSLSNEKDMIAWHTLLRECDFLPTMCAAVSSVLSCNSSWTVAHHSQETNCALADLLKREAFHPQSVTISQGGKFCCNSECVIRALATCPSTLVHLHQESQFYAWNDPTTSDSLIIPLQPPGSLQEFWGHLGVEGAYALRHFHQLTELNIRVSSLEALASLTYSIKFIGPSLRYLYIRLDLPIFTPVNDIEPLNFKGRNLWLRIKGVEDDSLSWVKEVTQKLSDWYTEVVLEKSCLSPSAVQEIKKCLPNTSLQILA